MERCTTVAILPGSIFFSEKPWTKLCYGSMNCSTCPSREHVLLVWVCEINPMGQVSGHMLTLAQAKHCWIQCVPEVSGLLCAVSDIKYFEKKNILYSATVRLKQLMMFFPLASVLLFSIFFYAYFNNDFCILSQ